MDGQGADEYIGGYDQYKYYVFNQLYQKGQLFEFIEEKKAYKKAFGKSINLGYKFLLDPLLKLLNIKRKFHFN